MYVIKKLQFVLEIFKNITIKQIKLIIFNYFTSILLKVEKIENCMMKI